MQRISSPTAVAALPAPVTGGVPGYFAQYTPGVGVPTIMSPDWANDVQEEVMAVIHSGGLLGSLGSLTQLRDSVMAIGYFTDSGAANAYVITTALTVTDSGITTNIPAVELLTGTRLWIRAANTNTGASKVTIDGTQYSWTNNAGGALVAGDIVAGSLYPVAYDGAAIRLSSVSNGQISAMVAAMIATAIAGLSTTATSIAGASHTYAAADADQSIRRSNGGALMVDAFPGGAGALAAGWNSIIVNADPSAPLVLVVAGGSTLSGPGATNNTLVLGPGQQAQISCDGANYTCYGAPARAKLGANLTLYVSTTGSDTNHGFNSVKAFATLQHAYSWAQQALDLAGYQLVISIVAGAFTAGATLAGPITGQASAVYVSGAGAANTSITASAGLIVVNGANILVQNIAFVATNAGGSSCIACSASYSGLMSTVFIGPGVSFSGGTFAQIIALGGGRIVLGNSYTIAGGGVCHWYAGAGGIIDNGNTSITVTLTGTPAFSSAFALAFAGAIMNPENDVTFTGAATGVRYATSSGGIINTAGSGASYLPGSSAGSGTGYY